MKIMYVLLTATVIVSLLISQGLAAQTASVQSEARVLLQLVQLSGVIASPREVERDKQPQSVREAVRRRLIRDITLSD